MIQKQGLYKKSAMYYDLIYSWKNYKKEANTIRVLINKYNKSGGRDLLEIACGTGKHTEYLKKHYRIIAINLHPEMLQIARKRAKNVTYKQADMTKLSINKKFDAIICLFSSIGYVKTYTNLKKTLRGFSQHLKQGGVVIIEPWIKPADYHIGTPMMNTYSDKDIKIARLSVSRKKNGNISHWLMHYLVAEKNKGVTYIQDLHELGMFEKNAFLKIMKDCGFKAQFTKTSLMKGRGLYVGVKI